MNWFVHFDGLEEVTLNARPIHLAIGMFDGVHLGHTSVIESAVQKARRMGGLAGVLTFWPHPSALFRPENRTRMITSSAERTLRLSEMDVDFVVTEPFTPAFAEIEAEDFVSHLKRFIPLLHTVYVGENWRFGRGRRGDIGLLVKLGAAAGVNVVSAPRINYNGEPVSSTRIRSCIESGAIEEANALLGYVYAAEGQVVRGKQLGRTLGFPTLNLAWWPDLMPRLGVYAVRVIDPAQAKALFGVANFGLRPTVEETPEPKLEVHVLGECPWSEGVKLRVELHAFLRPEKKFAGLPELTSQIAQDRAAAQAYFQARPGLMAHE